MVFGFLDRRTLVLVFQVLERYCFCIAGVNVAAPGQWYNRTSALFSFMVFTHATVNSPITVGRYTDKLLSLQLLSSPTYKTLLPMKF